MGEFMIAARTLAMPKPRETWLGGNSRPTLVDKVASANAESAARMSDCTRIIFSSEWDYSFKPDQFPKVRVVDMDVVTITMDDIWLVSKLPSLRVIRCYHTTDDVLFKFMRYFPSPTFRIEFDCALSDTHSSTVLVPLDALDTWCTIINSDRVRAVGMRHVSELSQVERALRWLGLDDVARAPRKPLLSVLSSQLTRDALERLSSPLKDRFRLDRVENPEHRILGFVDSEPAHMLITFC